MSTITYILNTLFPPMPREIVVVRHAESSRNLGLGGRIHFATEKELELYGADADSEVGITANGELQAKKVGKMLASFRLFPDVVIHSGYRRTQDTADLILLAFPNSFDIPLVENSDFRERRTGYTEHMFQGQAEQHFPWKDHHWKRNGPYMAVPPGGESLIGMRESRIRHGIRDVCQKYAGQRVYIIGHGRTNMCIHMELTGMSLRQADAFCRDHKNTPKNCSVSRYRYSPSTNSVEVISYAEDLIEEVE